MWRGEVSTWTISEQTDLLSTQSSQADATATDGPTEGHMDLLGHKGSWALASPTGKDYSY